MKTLTGLVYREITHIYYCLVSCFGLECLDFEDSSYSQLPGSLSPDYKYLSFTSQTIPDCIRYVICVFCKL